LGGAKQRFVPIRLDIDPVLAPKYRGNAIRRIRAILDQEDAAVMAGLHRLLNRGALDSDLPRRERPHAQFVGHHSEAHERAHAGNKHSVGDRLGEDFVGAGFEAAIEIGRLIGRRHHDHGDMLRRLIRFQTST
jgi:hypothetical protein